MSKTTTQAAVPGVMDLLKHQRQRVSIDLLNRYNQQDFLEARRLLNHLDEERQVGKRAGPEGDGLRAEHRRALDLVLGYYEDLAITIRVGAADEEILYLSLARVVKADFDLARLSVAKRREERENNAIYYETECLVRAWEAERSYSKPARSLGPYLKPRATNSD